MLKFVGQGLAPAAPQHTYYAYQTCRGRRPRRPETYQQIFIKSRVGKLCFTLFRLPCVFVGDGVLFCPETYQQIFIKSRVGELCFTSVGQGLAPAVPQQFIKDKLKLNHQI